MQPLIVAEQLTQAVADFLKTAFPATTPGFTGLIERFLDERDNIFKGPYLSVPLPFRVGAAGQSPFAWLPAGFQPHAHQALAFTRLNGESAQSTLVATGTGSGKTECFLYPLLEHCRLARERNERGIKAIILYPMNALATMHRVKGLEFDAVIIAGYRSPKTYAEYFSRDEDAGVNVDNETAERCLLHVAATRAKRNLFVIGRA